MEKNDLKSQIEYCEACMMVATTADGREMYKSILESLKQLQTINSDAYFYLTDTKYDDLDTFYEMNIKVRPPFTNISYTQTGIGKCIYVCV